MFIDLKAGGVLRLTLQGDAPRVRRISARAVNRELGLPTPLLTTPLNYVGGDDDNG